MRRLVYQVAIGPRRPLWEQCIESMARYCARHGFTHEVQREPILRIRPKASQRSEGALRLGYLPNCEKMAGLSLFDQFEQIAIVDSDVWATADAPSIFDGVPPSCDLAAVTERALPISPIYARKLDRYERMQFAPLDGVGLPFLQCGVIVYNRSFTRFMPGGPKGWYEQLELERFVNGEGPWRWQTEQVTLSWFCRAKGVDVAALDPRFNWLFGAILTAHRLEGWFHHMFLSEHLTGTDPEQMVKMGTGRPRL